MTQGAGSSPAEWAWAVRNVVAALAAVLLASFLSGLQVFRDASLGSNGLSAAEAVQFFGYGAALWMIWISAWHAAAQVPERGPLLSLLRDALPPFATLIILPSAYHLLLLPLHPFLGYKGVETILSWIFVLPFVSTAVWLGLVLYADADALALAAATAWRRLSAAVKRVARVCRTCGAPVPAEAKFCGKCGSSLEQPGQAGQGADAAKEHLLARPTRSA